MINSILQKLALRNANKQNKIKKFSDNGMGLLLDWEKLRLHPYDDTTGKNIYEWNEHATIAVGYLIPRNEWNKYKDGITYHEAMSLFYLKLKKYVNRVVKSIKKNVNQNQFDALVIFCYNIGIGGFKSSSVVKLINNPNVKTGYKDLESAWKAWNKQKQKVRDKKTGKMKCEKVVVSGLINRRNKEWKLYNS